MSAKRRTAVFRGIGIGHTSKLGTMHVRAEYLTIDPPRCIVYTQQFVDEREQLAPAPGAETWPATLLTTVLFTEETPDRTRVT